MPLAARIALFPVLVVVNIALAFAFSWIPGLIHPILGWLAFIPAAIGGLFASASILFMGKDR